MMDVTDVETRRNKILEIIIEAYVSTTCPVGSELVSRRLRSGLSPATIRNIMAELEERGLLEQPHISAGRVPTERGFRFYVDMVMDARHLPPEQLRQLEALIQPPDLGVEELLERARMALSELTQQAAFVIAPTVKHSTVKQVEFVPLSIRKLLCVLVVNEEMIASRVVEMEEPMSRDEAAALARFLNTELVGLSLSSLLESLERRMLADSDSFYHFVKRSLAILQHAFSAEPSERLFLDGASYMVSQPEFSRDPTKAHHLLKSLDAEEAFLGRVSRDLAPNEIRVRIGHEVQVPGLEECSYVTGSFVIGDDVTGGIGVLGPMRMDYPRMRAFVEGMGRCLTNVFARWSQG
ncbi:MAG: heat-inducible transcriptional repressor HrcA [Candidatus Omnitrophota bacterium]|nr:heat-inducible transcriptional repressor HrcA [Candidatus Omnitrophota bacterium]